jgi:dihydroflavonol-4-reductase
VKSITLQPRVKTAPASRRRVLVTGGNGFIGQHLVVALRRRHEIVRVLDLQPPPSGSLSEFIQGTILDPYDMRCALDGVDTVYHLAAISHLWTANSADFERVNQHGTEFMLAAARERGVRNIVHCSTEAILFPYRRGETKRPQRVEHMPGPYTRSKFMAEQAARDAAADGLRVVIANPTVPIGPGDHNFTEPMRMIQLFARKPPPMVLDSMLNLVDVRDVATGLILAGERGQAGERYILGGENVSVRELARRVGSLCSRSTNMRTLPGSVALAIGAASEWFEGRIMHRMPRVSIEAVRIALRSIPLDARKAETELGYLPHAIDDALADAVAWLTRHEAREAVRPGVYSEGHPGTEYAKPADHPG